MGTKESAFPGLQRPRGRLLVRPTTVQPRMDLLEYQGKQLFARHGVPVPNGQPARTVEDAVAAAEAVGYRCAIKAQVQIGGGGKLGGIKIAADRAEAEQHARAILGMDIRGLTVHELWIEAASQIESEYYASVVFDRSAKAPLVMLSTKGGMDIEQVADEDPEAIATLHVDPLLGFQDFHGRRLAYEAGVDADVVRPVGAMLAKLYEVFTAEEATLVEVNPLIITPEREVRALDAKVTLDDNALYRHPDNAALRDLSAEDPQEVMAKERGLTYVKLDGNIGILANGAGLSMSTLDVVAEAGGAPANFLDAGGGSRADAVTAAVEVILSDPKVKAVLFNIFGGITRCEETFHTLRNRDYGTQVVGGVTPGKGGQDVDGIPVFNTFHEAVDKTGANTAMVFVPPRFAADSILEAEDAGIELIICITEGIPAHDELRVYNTLAKN